MPSTLRTFLGIRIPPTPALRNVLKSLGNLGKAIKPTQADDLHITLKFLGPTPAELVAEIAGEMRDACTTIAPLATRMRGLGAFPSAARPNVIWAGFDHPGELELLAMDLDDRLTPLGYPPEPRPFHPHVTLARVKFRPPEELRVLLSELEAADFGAVTADTVELFQSEPGPAGSQYISLARAPLTNAPRHEPQG